MNELVHLGPATPDLLWVEASGSGTCSVYRWPKDPRPCPFCDKPIVDMDCIAIMPDGEWRWAHILCTLEHKGGRSDMVPGAPWKRRERGPCVHCGADVDDHVLTNVPTGRFCDETLLQRFESQPAQAAA